MAGMIYEFIDGLKKEAQIYEKLIELAEAKRTQIIKGDTEKISEFNKKEELVVLTAKGYERKRNQIMADIASIINENPKTVTLTQIINAMKNQPEEARELAEIKETFSKTLERLKTINNENMSLINQSLDFAEFSINVMQSRMGAEPLTANYGKNDGKRGDSFFDAKQ